LEEAQSPLRHRSRSFENIRARLGNLWV